jgi:hypothetical protein
MVEILFGLFVWNNNGELRRTTVIPSLLWNSRIAVFSLFRNNRFAFGCTTAIPIPRTAAILLFLTHPNIPEGYVWIVQRIA